MAAMDEPQTGVNEIDPEHPFGRPRAARTHPRRKVVALAQRPGDARGLRGLDDARSDPLLDVGALAHSTLAALDETTTHPEFTREDGAWIKLERGGHV
jgi:hypothetical protein